MEYITEKYVVGADGTKVVVGDIVNIKLADGGGCGSCTITKITDTGFRFTQDGKKEKTVQYRNIRKIEVIKSINRRSTGRYDMKGVLIKEGDIIEVHVGTDKVLAEHFIIKFGTYQAFCPVDKEYMDSIGFYVSGKDYPDMPIGTIEEYGKKIGNIYDNPELVQY